MKIGKEVLIILVFIITSFSLALSLWANSSKDNVEKPVFLLNGGVGFSEIKDHMGFSFGGFIAFLKKNNIYSLRYIRNDRIHYTLPVNPSQSENREYIDELGLLYGKIWNLYEDILMMNISIGISRVNGQKLGRLLDNFEYEKIKIETFGIPFSFQLFNRFNGPLAICIHFFGNYNNESSFYGILLGLQFTKYKK